ncbi:MAG: hypothetical protein ACI865_003188, partial [Flavobacteriaceae bacterium]
DSYEIEISPMNARVIYEDIGSGSILKLINLSLAIGMHMVQATKDSVRRIERLIVR